MTAVYVGPETKLPWTTAADDDKRFKGIARNGLLALLVISIIIPWLPVEELTREKQEEVPPQLAQVILEKKEIPKPPPPPPKPESKKEEKPKEKPKAEEKPKPKEPPKEQKVDVVKEARDKAAVAGLMAFQDDLADMRESVDTSSLDNNLTRGDQTAAKSERSVITSGKTAAGSGGIATAALSTQTGGSALSSHETTRVQAPVDTNQVAQGGKSQSAQAGGRGDNDVRRIMDQNKGGIFSIYNRALKKNPTLQGKYVFEMVIEPSGEISSIKLISSELADQELSNKILARIRLIRFPAKSVVSTKVRYSFDFLPY